MADTQDINKLADHLFRENSGKMVAILSRIFGLQHIDLIMDLVNDTFEIALRKWKYNEIPENPSAWLMQVAKNKAINSLKRDGKMTIVDPLVFVEDFNTEEKQSPKLDRLFLPTEIEDSQLRLLLTCCHPDLSDKNQIILTLNILSGFGVREIANALLMKSDAVKKALKRSKERLREHGKILQAPLLPQQEQHIQTVHTILYLMFNEGYKPTRSEEMINNDLCYESIRLAKLLLKQGVALRNESAALLSLMFFNLARFPARTSATGEIITLEEQNRSEWNKAFIEEGYFYLGEATKVKQLSRYHLEAIISSLHCVAESYEKTDWKTIIYLYEQLELLAPSPLVTLNKIVAKSYMNKPQEGIAELDSLNRKASLQNYYLLHAAKGDMLRRSGKPDQAKRSFESAYQYAVSPLERQFLKRRIIECEKINNN